MGETRAVVIGASVAGLLAASVLAESFSRVTVFDRDTLPQEAEARQGVPQSRQAHALQARGLIALDELLPGFADEIVAAGGVRADQQRDIHWYLDDHLLFPAESGLTGVGITRPTLERMIRGRVASLPGVEIVDATAVDGLVTDGGATGRVSGVRLRAKDADGDSAKAVPADLVVDAGGRASWTPVWLRAMGYPEPSATELRVDVIYVTRHVSAPPGQLNGLGAAVYTPYPGKHRGGALIRQEGDKWVVLIAGMLGEDPPASDEGFREYAKSFAGPEMATVLEASQPLDEPVKMRFPGSVRRHYEKLDRFPDGLIVMGDALCSFNPVYGQGMTVAAVEALALRRLIAGGGTTGLAARFAKAAGKVVDEAWALSAGGDLRFPEVAGTRKLADRIAGAYLDRFRPAAAVDPALGKAFVRVANMIDPPTKLLTPGNVVRVLQARRVADALRRKREQEQVHG